MRSVLGVAPDGEAVGPKQRLVQRLSTRRYLRSVAVAVTSRRSDQKKMLKFFQNKIDNFLLIFSQD